MFKKIRKNYLHIVLIIIILLSLFLSVFYFKNAWIRLIESLVDFKNSILFYISELFDIDFHNKVSVIRYSKLDLKMPFGLPNDFEEFKRGFSSYWKVFFSISTFKSYIKLISDILYYLSKVILIIMPVFLIMYIFILKNREKTNNDYNEKSKALIFWLKIENKVFIPIINWFKNFKLFLKKNNFYKTIFILIWFYNFNFITIIIEAIAFYFFFISTIKIKYVYVQFIKLLLDLAPMFYFLPNFIWIFVSLFIINKIRKRRGYANLNHLEMRNRGFINERPIVLMLVGTMGKRKTTIGTDIALSQEVMFRDKALEKILEQDLMFPNFPFINLELVIKNGMKKHHIYNLATCKKFIKIMSIGFYLEQELGTNNPIVKSIKRYLRKTCNYNYKNMIFDYEYTDENIIFNNGLQIKSIYDVIETYAQLYLIYIIQSSLIISNYSIRVDNILQDVGNFPLWNSDFFEKDSKLSEAYSRHSHILDFDSLRLGKTIIDDNYKRNSLEFGVINITEIGKERGNNLELQHLKKNDESCNQKNDLFNHTLKMIRHRATVDNYSFIKIITDEQRCESWGQDARDLCEIVHINQSSSVKLAMPLFSLEDLLIQIFLDLFRKAYIRYRFNRGDMTLLMYLYHNLASKLNSYRNTIYNTFGFYDMDLSVELGTRDGELFNKSYYLMFKKIYSNRFSTDCFSDFFMNKSIKSAVGIDDLEEYATSKATFDELALQNSYFFNDLTKLQK